VHVDLLPVFRVFASLRRRVSRTYNLTVDFLENEDEELAFYNHDSNRAVAVVWPAIVENRLTDALRAYMRPDEKIANELFRPEGALGTFAQKIKLGYMLGLYQEDLKDDLVLLAKIRNAFAHRVDITAFEVSPVRDWMDNMTTLKVHRALLERMKKENPQDVKGKTALSILSSELMDYRNSFHLCIRFMIHQLLEMETTIRSRRAANTARKNHLHNRTPNSPLLRCPPRPVPARCAVCRSPA
jgi:hypothetical protein